MQQYTTSYLWSVWVCFGTRGLDLSYISLQCSSSKQTLTQSFVFMAQPEHRVESSNSYLTPTLAVFLFLLHFSCRSAFSLGKKRKICFHVLNTSARFLTCSSAADREKWHRTQICVGLLSVNWHAKWCRHCNYIQIHSHIMKTDLTPDFPFVVVFFLSPCGPVSKHGLFHSLELSMT